MRMERCTRGIVAALLVFLLIALFLDDPCFLAGVISLVLFLVMRYLIFIHNVRLVAASVTIVRKTDKPNTRQGSAVSVTTVISLDVPDSFTVKYEEGIVAGLNVNQGDIASENISAGSNIINLSYSVIPFLHGNIEFPGGLLTIKDLFFRLRLPVSGRSFCGPVLKVYPYRLLEKSPRRSEFGGREIEQLRPVHGFGIRMYREYVVGDDVRNVDWKLSAKQDSLIVREFTGLESSIPLIIVDLPDKEAEYDQNAFQDMISAVAVYIERSLKEKVGTSFIIISGPNIIDSIIEERSRSRYMNIIRERLHPQFRLHSMYRMARKSAIREGIQTMRDYPEETPDEKDIFSNKIVHILQKHLLVIGTTRFSSQISRIIGMLNVEDVYLYSLCDGDLSHIQEISLQARRLHLGFRIRTPMINNDLLMKRAYRLMKGEIIEGIA